MPYIISPASRNLLQFNLAKILKPEVSYSRSMEKLLWNFLNKLTGSAVGFHMH